MNGLVLSLFLHAGHSIYSLIKYKGFSIHNLISLWFTFIVMMGFITVDTGIYQEVHGYNTNFPYKPYILEFLFFLIFMWPFRSLSDKEFIITDFPVYNKNFKFLFVGVLISYGFYFFLLLKVAVFVLSQKEMAAAYQAIHFDGASLYDYSGVEEKIKWICGSIYDWTSPIVLIYAIFGIIKGNNGLSYRFNVVCLIMVVAMFFLDCISTGQRGGIFFFGVRLLFVFVPLWPKFPTKAKKTVRRYIPFVVASFSLYAAMMTIARVENSTVETPITTVLRYLGEPYPHLGNAFWEQVITHPMGARLFPFLIEANGNTGVSLGDQHAFWEVVTGVPILNYKTLYGDFYVDFGPYIPFVIIFFHALLLKSFVKSRTISFAAYPILYYYIIMASAAPLWFNLREWYGVKLLLAALCAYLMLNRISKMSHKRGCI